MMELKEFYNEIGADYNAAITYIRKEDKLVKYLKSFDAAKNISSLRDGIAGGDYQKASLVVDGIYETAKMLSLTSVIGAAEELIKVLREGNPGSDIGFLVDHLDETASRVQRAVKEML